MESSSRASTSTVPGLRVAKFLAPFIEARPRSGGHAMAKGLVSQKYSGNSETILSCHIFSHSVWFKILR